jgi:hypothetical protein
MSSAKETFKAIIKLVFISSLKYIMFKKRILKKY